MCRSSEGNVAGLVRLQRLVGQEAAASLLTVLRCEHDLHPTAVAGRGWSGVAKGTGSMPTPPDLRSGRGGRRHAKRGPGGRHSGADRCMSAWLNRGRTPPRSRADHLSAETLAWPTARQPGNRYSCPDARRHSSPSARPRCPTTSRSAASNRGSEATEVIVRLQRVVRPRLHS
jgi:hypothetical protein